MTFSHQLFKNYEEDDEHIDSFLNSDYSTTCTLRIELYVLCNMD